LSIRAPNFTFNNISYTVLDCGRVSKEIKNEHSLEATPWIVDIYRINKQSNTYDVFNEGTDSNYHHLGLGTIISPNVVVAGKVLV